MDSGHKLDTYVPFTLVMLEQKICLNVCHTPDLRGILVECVHLALVLEIHVQDGLRHISLEWYMLGSLYRIPTFETRKLSCTTSSCYFLTGNSTDVHRLQLLPTVEKNMFKYWTTHLIFGAFWWSASTWQSCWKSTCLTFLWSGAYLELSTEFLHFKEEF